MSARKTRVGNQEPTRSMILPYRKSHGREAVELYQRTGRKAMPWQKSLIKHIMAIGRGGLWKHQKFGFSVPRRNGKSEIINIRELWGLENGERICHTAHRTDTSRNGWLNLCRLLTDAGYEELGRKKKDEPDPENGFRTNKQQGREEITLVRTGGKICFRTRTRNSGLGQGFDLLVIDEAQEYTDDQETALVYTVSDSKNPQTLFCGTPPTPVSSGTVFLKMRDEALSGDAFETGWAEWSVDRQTDRLLDRELWYLTNPSLGYHLAERVVQSEIRRDAGAVVDFNIQRLGLWIQYNLKSAISEAEWGELRESVLPALTGKLFVGIKYGHDGANVSMSVAVRTDDDRIFVEAIGCRSVRTGNDWILGFLATAEWEAVVADGENGNGILAQSMKDMGMKAPILPKVKEVILANAAFEQALQAGRICHMGQPSLAQAVANCEKRAVSANGGFGYRSLRDDIDISLMDSMIFAYWACANYKPRPKQRLRY